MSARGDVSLSGWFGPQRPLLPVAPPQVSGRQFDLRPGYNIVTQARSGETISFAMLRQLADSFDILRLVIETRKDQMDRMAWSFRSKKIVGQDKTEKIAQSRLDAVTKFFLKPDGEHNFTQWLRMILEDLFVLDAPTLWKQRDRGGRLIALHPLDGGTIKRVIDDWGRTPLPYNDESGTLVTPPAYQQILKGFPAVDYTTSDLIYAPRNIRTNRVYGYSPVEQIIMTVNIAMRRQLGTLEYYTEGNVPSALIGVPDTWTPDQIKNFQDYWDLYFSGDTATRRKAKFVPGGVAKTFIPTKEPELKGIFDEWLAKVVCFAFSVSPQAFVSQVNRATAGTQKEMAEEEGLAPILQWTKHLIDEVIATELGEPNIEFAWGTDEQIQPELEATILNSYTSNATMTKNEAREKLGLEPIDCPEADALGFTTAAGFVYLDEKLKPPPQAPLAPVGPDGQPVKQMLPPSAGSADKKLESSDEPKSPAKPAKSAKSAKADDAPSAAKIMEILEDYFEKGEGHDVSGEARDSRGRFASSGGPTARERRKAERNAQRDPENEPITRDESGRFVKGKVTKRRMKQVADTISVKIAVAAALSVGASILALSGAQKTYAGRVFHSHARKAATNLFFGAAVTAMATAFRIFGADSDMADTLARHMKNVFKDMVDPKRREKFDNFGALEPAGDLGKSDDESDEDFVLRASRVILPRVLRDTSDALLTHIEAHGASPELSDGIEKALDEVRSEMLADLAKLSGEDDLEDLRKGLRRLDPLLFDRKAVRKATALAAGTLRRAFQRAGAKAAATVAAHLSPALERVAKARTDDPAAARIAAALDLSDIEEIYVDLGDDIAGAATDAAHRTLIQIGPDSSGDLVGRASSRAAAWARDHAASMLGKKVHADGTVVDVNVDGYSVTDATRDKVRTAIADGIAAGETLDEIVARVQDAGFSPDRAQQIAEDAVGDANSAGTLEGYAAAADAGVTVLKSWLTVGDERVDSDICQANEDQGPIPVDEPFQSGHMAPLGHPRCRCSLVPYVDDSAEKLERFIASEVIGVSDTLSELHKISDGDDLALDLVLDFYTSDAVEKYSSSEARDDNGRWTSIASRVANVAAGAGAGALSGMNSSGTKGAVIGGAVGAYAGLRTRVYADKKGRVKLKPAILAVALSTAGGLLAGRYLAPRLSPHLDLSVVQNIVSRARSAGKTSKWHSTRR